MTHGIPIPLFEHPFLGIPKFNIDFIRFINEIFFNNSNIGNFDSIYEDDNGEQILINNEHLQKHFRKMYITSN